MLVLDTDLLSIVQRKTGADYQRLLVRFEAAFATHSVRTTIISYEGQMRGWLSFIKKAKDFDQQIVAYERLMELFEDYHTRRILKFDSSAAAVHEKLFRARIRIGTMDLEIARPKPARPCDVVRAASAR